MKETAISIILFILSLLIGAGCMFVVYNDYGQTPLSFLYLIGMIASFPLHSLWHELGHIVFGAIAKIKAVPEIKGSKKVFGWSSCKIIPKTHKNLKGRIIFTALGGLAFNFLLIVLGVVSLFVKAVPSAISICVLPASFYLFAFNAIPFLLEDGKTDGLVINELAKNDDNAKVTIAVLTVQAQILSGKSIEEVDEKLLFDLPVIQEDDAAFISLTELRYEYFKAKGNEEQAQKYKQRLDGLMQYLP